MWKNIKLIQERNSTVNGKIHGLLSVSSIKTFGLDKKKLEDHEMKSNWLTTEDIKASRKKHLK